MGDLSLIPGLGRSPAEEKGYPLQYYGLENSMDCIVSTAAAVLHFILASCSWSDRPLVELCVEPVGFSRPSPSAGDLRELPGVPLPESLQVALPPGQGSKEYTHRWIACLGANPWTRGESGLGEQHSEASAVTLQQGPC